MHSLAYVLKNTVWHSTIYYWPFFIYFLLSTVEQLTRWISSPGHNVCPMDNRNGRSFWSFKIRWTENFEISLTLKISWTDAWGLRCTYSSTVSIHFSFSYGISFFGFWNEPYSCKLLSVLKRFCVYMCVRIER